MPDTIKLEQLQWCSYCHAAVAVSQYLAHNEQHSRLTRELDTAENIVEGMGQAIRVLERQAQQLLERVSQLEARTAWGPASGPPQYGQGSSWTCPVCDLGELVLVLGGRNPGLRCGNCGRPVSSG